MTVLSWLELGLATEVILVARNDVKSSGRVRRRRLRKMGLMRRNDLTRWGWEVALEIETGLRTGALLLPEQERGRAQRPLQEVT